MKATDLKVQLGGFSINIDKLELKNELIYGIIGANGSGKSTLINILSGLQKTTSGEIDFDGLTVSDITTVSRKPYILHTSVYNNLIYPLKIRKAQADKNLIEYYLELIGFTERKNEYAPLLSSGEQQKLALARAMIFSPKFLMLDEAMSNLDIESLRTFEALIKSKQRENPITWLIVSHQLSHINRMCDYIFFMQNGKISEEGTKNEILFNPRSEALISFLRNETLEISD